jgi:hypothetical protein
MAKIGGREVSRIAKMANKGEKDYLVNQRRKLIELIRGNATHVQIRYSR